MEPKNWTIFHGMDNRSYGVSRDGVAQIPHYSKGLKVNTRKTKMMVSGSEGELFKSRKDP